MPAQLSPVTYSHPLRSPPPAAGRHGTTQRREKREKEGSPAVKRHVIIPPGDLFLFFFFLNTISFIFIFLKYSSFFFKWMLLHLKLSFSLFYFILFIDNLNIKKLMTLIFDNYQKYIQ